MCKEEKYYDKTKCGCEIPVENAWPGIIVCTNLRQNMIHMAQMGFQISCEEALDKKSKGELDFHCKVYVPDQLSPN